MHATTELTEPADASAQTGATAHTSTAGETEAEAPELMVPATRCLIPIADLTGHPGNVREDLNLTEEFIASIAAEGVRIPLLITTGPDGTSWRVIEGHRRLAAAIKAGLGEVPCDIDPSRATDEAGQYLDMLLANSGGYRSNFGQLEEAAALFAAHEAGASRTRLRKATGRTATQIKAALSAGGLPAETRARAAEANSDVTLDQIALLAEFDGDAPATDRLLQALANGYPLEHVASRIRQDRAEAAAHAELRADLQAAGIQVTDDLPEGAAWLTSLTHDGADLTPETHAACPGRGTTLKSWDLLEPWHYCTSPAEHGHASRWTSPATATTTETSDGTAGLNASPDPSPVPDCRLVITGNKSWQAAADVRHRWLTDSLLADKSAPREAQLFLARQLLAMPDPLRSGLAAARHKPLFAKLTGRDPGQVDAECDTAAAARLTVLALAPVVTAYEQAMTEGDGRNTWRTDRYSPCPRADAGAYLAFLASLGYQLSGIEQAVADGTKYPGTA
ncbi:MAG TPA: ParB/RepB/Spo0J family partition protein [Streptosporangiaceae bacterium]|nr:ParB/RepB/Spo0J family partition protein [Streptosporangiaceae bacterium]